MQNKHRSPGQHVIDLREGLLSPSRAMPMTGGLVEFAPVGAGKDHRQVVAQPRCGDIGRIGFGPDIAIDAVGDFGFPVVH